MLPEVHLEVVRLELELAEDVQVRTLRDLDTVYLVHEDSHDRSGLLFSVREVLEVFEDLHDELMVVVSAS